jgi:hypothetical protein
MNPFVISNFRVAIHAQFGHLFTQFKTLFLAWMVVPNWFMTQIASLLFNRHVFELIFHKVGMAICTRIGLLSECLITYKQTDNKEIKEYN